MRTEFGGTLAALVRQRGVSGCMVVSEADGIIVEVHPNPERAKSDGAQSLYPEQFSQLMREVRAIANAIGRTHDHSFPWWLAVAPGLGHCFAGI